MLYMPTIVCNISNILKFLTEKNRNKNYPVTNAITTVLLKVITLLHLIVNEFKFVVFIQQFLLKLNIVLFKAH